MLDRDCKGGWRHLPPRPAPLREDRPIPRPSPRRERRDTAAV